MVRVPARSSLASIIIIGATLGLALAKLMQDAHFLIPYWYWILGVVSRPTWPRLWPGMLGLLLFLAGTVLLRKSPAWLFVAWVTLGAAAVPVLLQNLVGDPVQQLFACTISGGCTGAFRAALEITPTTLRDWPDLMLAMQGRFPHIALSAPGWPYLYYGVSQVLAGLPRISEALAGALRPLQCSHWDIISLTNPQLASAWLGIASPLWGALTVVPLYGLGRAMAGDRVARRAIAWWPIVPALTFFTGSLTIINPLLAVLTVALFWGGLNARARRWSMLGLFVSGIVMALALLLSLALLPVLMLCGLLAACALWLRHDEPSRYRVRRLALVGAAFCLGLAPVMAVYWWLAGYAPFSLLGIAMNRHLATQPPYLPTMALNAWDFVAFAGLPAVGLALAYAFGPRPAQGITVLAIALGATLLTLEVAGIARSEVGRVWMFFVPFVLLVAASAAQGFTPAQRGLLALAQVVWLLALALTFWPAYVQLPPNTAYASVAKPPLPTPIAESGAVFDDALRLTGYQAQYRPGTHSLAVALRWQALKPIAAPYYFSAVLVAPNGRVLPGVTWQPFDTRYPTTCWLPAAMRGQPVVDQVELPLGPGDDPGNWWLSLSAFTMAQDRPSPPVSIRLADGTRDRQVGIGPLAVLP